MSPVSITGYKIFYQGEGDTVSMMEDVGSISAEDWSIDSGVQANVIYNITIVSVSGSEQSVPTGPVIAARGS